MVYENSVLSLLEDERAGRMEAVCADPSGDLFPRILSGVLSGGHEEVSSLSAPFTWCDELKRVKATLKVFCLLKINRFYLFPA